jgi:hypothetical protein
MNTRRDIFLLAVLFAARSAAGAVAPASGYAAHAIATPDTVQGGVVRRGSAILVGQGAFGAGGERIVRLDGGGATTVATGFNSLGGFDLDAAGTLYVADNGGEQAGAATGDTVFTIPNALTRPDAVSAAGHELLPTGTIPFAMDVLLSPDGSVLVSDAAGPGAGRVVRIRKGAAIDVIGGLNVQGLALGASGALLVSTLDDTYTVGTILRYSLRGAAHGTFATGLAGAFDHVLDTDGDLLVSGSGKVVALAPDGSPLPDRAGGFAFSTAMFFDTARDELLVLDAGASAVDAVCRDRDGDGVCDVDDDCPTVADAAQADGDLDGVGDACACTGGAIEKARVTIGNLATPAGDDTLAIKGVMTVPASPAVDPVTTGMRILVRDGAGTVLNATIPGGAFDALHQAGWKVTKSGAFTYQSALGLLGIRKVALKPSSKKPGQVRFAVAAKNGSYPADPAQLPLSAFVALASDAGQCGLATFPGPAPEPHCAYDATRGKLKCG